MALSPLTLLQAAFLNQDKNLDPRLEDIKEIQKVYKQLLKPYLTRNTSWVSPSSLGLVYLFTYTVRYSSLCMWEGKCVNKVGIVGMKCEFV